MMKGRSKKPFKKSYGFGRDKKESEQDVSKNGLLIRDLRSHVDLLEELAVKLDSTHITVHNWKHLALVLDVPPRDIESLQELVILPSPSWQLIEHLSVRHPDLTVRQFREALQTIKRQDAVATLDRYIFNSKGEYIGDVLDKQDLMVYLTALLDKEFRGIKNWKDLAMYVGIPRQDIIRFEQPKAMESPTKHLLDYVAVVRPHFTLNHLKSALQKIYRRDLVAIIDNYFDTSKVPVRENVLSELQQITWDTKVMDPKHVSSNMERIAVKRGFKVSDNPGSGDCMFYALSEQLERVKKIRITHDEVRKNLVQFLKENPNLPDGTELFNFVTGFPSWASYLKNMEREGIWGDHVMLYAAANRYEVSIRVISLSLEHFDVIIVPSCDVVDPKQLIIGHIQELHYVSLLPQKVPAEVLARGALAWEAYRKALALGSTRVMRLPIMVIGQYRSGKTCLIKSLKGETFNPLQDPTDRIEIDPNLFGLSRNLWSIEENKESDFSNRYEDCVGKTIAAILRNVESEESSQMIDPKSSDQWENTGIAPCPTDADDSDLKGVIQRQSPTPEERKKERVAEQTLPEKIEASTKKHLEEPEEKDSEEICAVVWDFAGQLVFYATHPIFLSPRAIFLLVNNLSWKPKDRANPVVHQQRFSRKEDEDCIKTNADYLDLWFSSVSCLDAGSKATENEVDEMLPEGLEWRLPDQLPPVILVCTHADCPYDPSREAKDLALEAYGLLKGKPYSNNLFEDYFAVNNKTSGSEVKCPELERLKKAITAIALQLPHVKQDIPITWLKFEKALQSRKEEGRHCIDLEQAKQIARECEIRDDQHTHVLNFLHDQRSVIHFHDSEVLKKSVILDVDWLIKVFKKVITVKRYNGESAHQEKLWEKLQTEGILADELLRIAWNDLQDGESSESLIAIMEKFGLLFPWPSGKEYFVPSVLMSPPGEEVIKLLARAHFPSLFIRFKQLPSQNCSVSGEVRYAPVPLGFFSRLILRFIQWCAEKQSNPSRPKLFQDFANFLVYPDEKCHVVLLRRFSFIELVVLKANPPERSQVKITPSDTDVCSSLRRKLKDMLTSMHKDFCWMKNVEYELSILCPVCCKGGSFTHCRKHTDCKQEECLHFWSEREICKSVEPCCEHTSVSTSESISLEAFKPWFIVSDGKEQSTVESLLSFKDSLLSDIIGDVNVMDELARQLDQPICHGEHETPSVKYWSHLAAELRMPIDTLIKCQHSFENSPSKFLFENKESLDTDFTVQCLKDRLGEIRRNDLVKMLDDCRLSDSATLDDLREKHADTFEIICLQLDHFNNWPALGKKIGISNEKLKQIKTSSSCAETVLEIIEKKNPNVTVKDMRVLAVEMERQDVCEELKKLPDHSKIVDLRSNLDCLEKVAVKLDQETPGLKNWYYFGWKFDIPTADLDSLKPKRNPSPTKRMIEYIVQAEPHLTVRSLIQKLKRIERLDVVTALKQFFCDSADVEAILAQDL